MGLFPNSFGNEYMLLCVNYVSTWLEAIPTRTNESKVVVKFLRENIFARYSMPRVIISHQGIHFDSRSFDHYLRGIPFSIILQPRTIHKLMVK